MSDHDDFQGSDDEFAPNNMHERGNGMGGDLHPDQNPPFISNGPGHDSNMTGSTGIHMQQNQKPKSKEDIIEETRKMAAIEYAYKWLGFLWFIVYIIAFFLMSLIYVSLATLALLIFDQKLLFKDSGTIQKVAGKMNVKVNLNVTSALIWKMTIATLILLGISVALYLIIWKWLFQKGIKKKDIRVMKKSNFLIFLLGGAAIGFNQYLQKNKNPNYKVSYKISVMGLLPFVYFWGPVATLLAFCGTVQYYAHYVQNTLVKQGWEWGLEYENLGVSFPCCCIGYKKKEVNPDNLDGFNGQDYEMTHKQ